MIYNYLQKAQRRKIMAIGQKYHISLNETGKWQVKGEKAGKALKVFDTQKDAIAYAKSVAGNQEGNIVIHKVDGKIRKQDYKPEEKAAPAKKEAKKPVAAKKEDKKSAAKKDAKPSAKKDAKAPAKSDKKSAPVKKETKKPAPAKKK